MSSTFLGYFDESGTDGALGTTIISGFAAPLRVWSEFVAEWSQALEASDTPYFHYVDCVNERRQYAGWADRRRPHLHQMAEIVARQPLIAFSVAHVGDFTAVMKKHEGWEVRFPSAYSFCFEFLINLIRKANHSFFDASFMLVMADQQEFKPRALDVWHHYKWASQWPEIKELSFADARVAKPLQAADMLAYETRRYVWRAQNGDDEYWREQPLLSRILPERPHRYVFNEAFDDEGLSIFLSQEKGQYLKTPPLLNANVPFSMLRERRRTRRPRRGS